MRNKRDFLTSIPISDIDGIMFVDFLDNLDTIYEDYETDYEDLEIVIANDAIEIYGIRKETLDEAHNRLQNILNKVNKKK